MIYTQSKALKGVYVHTPVSRVLRLARSRDQEPGTERKKTLTVVDTTVTCVGIVDARYVSAVYSFDDSRYAVLGYGDERGRGPWSRIEIHVQPIYVGWTRDGGVSYVTDDTYRHTYKQTSLGMLLKECGMGQHFEVRLLT